jgi:serine protease
MGRFIRMRQVTGGRVDNMIHDVHVPFANAGGETRAIEYRHSGLDHYFVAAGQDEIDILDNGGGGGGWQRTGESFKVWPQMPSDTFVTVAPACRFYGRPAGGPNSHFFTASASECEIVRRPGSGWFYEGVGFYIQPVGNPRVCPTGFLSVNRAYNNRAAQNDSNHRFTTSDSTLREMGRKGWAMEGTVMCARP